MTTLAANEAPLFQEGFGISLSTFFDKNLFRPCYHYILKVSFSASNKCWLLILLKVTKIIIIVPFSP